MAARFPQFLRLLTGSVNARTSFDQLVLGISTLCYLWLQQLWQDCHLIQEIGTLQGTAPCSQISG